MTFEPTTFALELVNFVVLAWLLTRFVYRPLSNAIVERRDVIAAQRAQAAAQLEEVDATRKALEGRSRELDTLRERIFAEATSEAATERARMIAAAREDAAGERERVQSLLEAEREAAATWVRDTAVAEGAAIAGRILVDLAPEAAHGALLERMLDEVAVRRDDLVGSLGPEPRVELTMARLPLPEEVDRVRDAFARIFDVHPRITTHEDEELVAGAVLRVQDRVFDASVHGQLEVLQDQARRMLEREGEA